MEEARTYKQQREKARPMDRAVSPNLAITSFSPLFFFSLFSFLFLSSLSLSLPLSLPLLILFSQLHFSVLLQPSAASHHDCDCDQGCPAGWLFSGLPRLILYTASFRAGLYGYKHSNYSELAISRYFISKCLA